MCMISGVGWEWRCQRRDDDQVAELQRGQDDATAGLGQVVLVAVAMLLDQTVQVESLEQPGDLRARAVGQDAAQGGVAKAADLPLAPSQGDEQSEGLGTEQVETPV